MMFGELVMFYSEVAHRDTTQVHSDVGLDAGSDAWICAKLNLRSRCVNLFPLIILSIMSPKESWLISWSRGSLESNTTFSATTPQREIPRSILETECF